MKDLNRKTASKRYNFLTLDTWQRWEYKHTTFVVLATLLFIVLLDTTLFTSVIEWIAQLEYIGALIAGILFVSLFTAAPAVITLVELESSGLNLIAVSLIAGAGAMLGDYLILRFVQDKVAYELKPLAMRIGVPQTISYLQKRRHTSWIVRILGAFIIASPLPDEIGIGLLGLTKMKNSSFLLLCFILNAIGIYLVLRVSQTL